VHWASAASDEPVLDKAIEALSRDIIAEMAGDPIDLAVVFVSRQFSMRLKEVSQLFRRNLPHKQLIGCSAGGVIGGGREIEQRAGLSLTAAHLPDVTITLITLEGSLLPDLDASPRAWHEALAVPVEPTPHFVLLADPFSFPASDFLAGLDYAYPKSVKVGGLASGAGAPGGNALYAGATTRHSGLVGVALSGNISVDTIVAQGCRPIGKPLRITRCDGNILFEIEGRPPVEVIRDLIGSLPERDRQLVQNALFIGVATEEFAGSTRTGDYLIRNLVGVDPQRGALAVGDHLRNGQIVQFHLRDAAASAEDLALLLDRFSDAGLAGGARGALLFSCLGRGIHLYGCADHDTGVFKERLGDLPIGGFFCNGEIGPVGGATHLHGYTSSFGIFSPAR